MESLEPRFNVKALKVDQVVYVNIVVDIKESGEIRGSENHLVLLCNNIRGRNKIDLVRLSPFYT